MPVQINDQMTINAPAGKVWSVLAHEYDEIDQWSNGITESRGVAEFRAPEGAAVGGRVCLPPRSGASATEAFSYYDEQAMRFGYQAVGELPWPWLLKSAENNWSISAMGSNTSQAAFSAEIDVKAFPGLLLLPLLLLIKKVLGTRTLEELKHYVEYDQPHPRKQKMDSQRIGQANAEHAG